jgi:hypothetical protein
MSKTIDVAWGLCAPMRPEHVLTMVQPYGVKVLGIEMYKNDYGSGAKLTVTDSAAKWVEYLLCRSGKFSLISKPLEPRNIQWAEKWQTVPIQRGCNAHKMEGAVTGTMGRMPTTWADKAKQDAAPRRGIPGIFDGMFGGAAAPAKRTRRPARSTSRKQRRSR